MKFKDDDFWKPVITTRQVLEGNDVIVCVTLDEEGDWEAVGEQTFTDDDLDVVSVEELLEKDPTLATLPDLGFGESAVRSSKESAWEKAE